MIDNLLECSTEMLPVDLPPQYVSAKHAVQKLLELLGGLAECPSVDIGRPVVQSSPVNGHAHALDELLSLKRVFDVAHGRARSRDWRLWCHVRGGGATRTVHDVAQRTVARAVRRVDALIEEELDVRGWLVRSTVRRSADV